MAKSPNTNLHAFVDMGSNGIRFSITDLSPERARILPMIYQDRSGISLYDVQYMSGAKAPIPESTVRQVVTMLSKFKRTCEDFGVPLEQIRIIATEATRTALNSVEYCLAIEAATGLRLELLPKEEEGRIGAFGVASSFSSVNGLVMDLGGGSVQLTFVQSNIESDGMVSMSARGSVSLPFGAAALSLKLKEAEKREGIHGQVMKQLGDDTETEIRRAIKEILGPEDISSDGQSSHSQFDLYLSGGGFRGFGYVMMAKSKFQPYPVPIINGFVADLTTCETVLAGSMIPDLVDKRKFPNSPFRISKRRLSQMPAITFLLQVILSNLKGRVQQLHFAQGGVREGLLFDSLDPAVRAQSPLVTATRQYAPPSASALLQLLYQPSMAATAAVESDPHQEPIPGFMQEEWFFASVINMMYAHAALPRETRAAAALRSTTSGLLTQTHGLGHRERILLAFVLCKRWGGEIAPTDMDFYNKITVLMKPWDIWWANLVAVLAAGLGSAFPNGVVRKGEGIIKLQIDCSLSRAVVLVNAWIWEGEPTEWVDDWIKDLRKLSKSKESPLEFPLRVEVHVEPVTTEGAPSIEGLNKLQVKQTS